MLSSLMTRAHVLEGFLVLAMAAGLSACSAEAPVEVPTKPCTDQTQCPVDQLCIDGLCQPFSSAGCATSADCPQGFKCLADGTCHQNAECEQDAECCPPGDRACAKQCVDFTCIGTACTDGQAKACYNGCHDGQAVCTKGDWGACNAPTVQPELCGDGIDNDCNGQTDDPALCPACQSGATQACSGPCGDGQQTCGADGQWSACSAPTDCTCEAGESTSKPCGSCGQEAGSCGAGGTWSWSKICTGEGLCGAGTSEEQACGSCGLQTRLCSEECTWGDWTACNGNGECEPDDVEQDTCGSCGGKTRVCGDDCVWGEWSECDTQGGCTPGVSTQSKACSKCGTQVSTCQAGCTWSDYGPCMDQGDCTVGEIQNQVCGNCGEKSRTCGNDCEWGLWTSCLGAGPCSPGDQETEACGPESTQGICEAGMRTRACNGSCQWNTFGSCLGATYPKTEVCGNGVDENCDGGDDTLPDNYEPNNNCQACHWLGEDPEQTLNGSFDNQSDGVDYFCFSGVDNFNLPLTAEYITVALTNQTAGLDADIHLYKGYSDCEQGALSALKSSVTIGGGDENIEWKEGNGDDDGTYIIEVRNYEDAGCYHYYTLSVKGLK